MTLRIILMSSLIFSPLSVLATTTDTFTVTLTVGNDVTAPSTPANISATAVSTTEIDISWDASTDDVAVTGYQLFRDGVAIATTTSLSYSDSGLSPETTYSYRVQAFDAAGNYSALSSTASATTLSPSTSTGGGQVITGNNFTVTPTAGIYTIDLHVSAPVPYGITVRWGLTPDVEMGTLISPLFRRVHDTEISGLSPDTYYWIVVQGIDESNTVVTKTLRVKTLVGPRPEAPANVINLRLNAEPEGIRLNWNNPISSDFDHVRVVRKDNVFPSDAYDGKVIYEGSRETFFDRDVVEGALYGYGVFAVDRDGNISSGAVGMIRAWQREGIPEPVPFPEPEEGAVLDDKTLLDSLQIRQYGRILSNIGGQVFIDADQPFSVYLDGRGLPTALKTIVVTLSPKNDPSQTFTFLLRATEDRAGYEAILSSLTDAGIYNLALSLLNHKTKVTAAASLALNVAALPSTAPLSEKDAARARDFILLLLALAIILTMLLIVIREHRREEEEK